MSATISDTSSTVDISAGRSSGRFGSISRSFATGSLLALGVLAAACAPLPAASEAASIPGEAMASASPSIDAPATVAPTASPTSSPEPIAWRQLDAAGPGAREDHTWTVDGGGRVAYLFGGRDGPTVFGDTWAYDLATDTWSELNPAKSPPARFGHEAVWVERLGLVVFAGQAGSAFFGDLWVYEPERNAWSELPATGSAPTPRYGSCAGLDPDGRLWISHGFTSDGTRFSDTRAYDFATGAWTDETPADGGRPVERCLHGCWWTDGGQLALFAGQTTGVTALDDRWTLADGAWSRVEGSLPPARNLYARARLDGATLIFGGQALDQGYLADLWLLADDEVDARPMEVSGDGPAGRAGAEIVRDHEGGRVLLFGGRAPDGALGDTWALSGV